MVGGPDDGLTSEQGGAMGESWGDLVAVEYLFSTATPTARNPWVVGPYVTGNKTVGIRDYAINDNPLNYCDFGFDTTGPEVHADGEIWNGANVHGPPGAGRASTNATFPYADKALQLRCAQARPRVAAAADACPGNRRWIQLDVRRVPAPAGRDEHARRPRRHTSPPT